MIVINWLFRLNLMVFLLQPVTLALLSKFFAVFPALKSGRQMALQKKEKYG